LYPVIGLLSYYRFKLFANKKMTNINKLESIIEYLNSKIWVRLYKSNFEVGVKAIRDIPKHTKITDYGDETLDDLSLKYFFIDYKTFLENFYKLHPQIQTLLKDRYIFSNSGQTHIISPNCHQIFRLYINHSENPNVNKDLISIRDIKEEEEITFSYKDIISEDINILSKKYYNYVI